ncbi:MAG: 3-deoxy-D-manno-octulosonate 8-phosphate phosphatase [Planctomycetes bacterium]|nr:3-deoxy-D-manno-octulosonate 8-phosphate phosphatase [Planctomycetota bacterium]
MAKAVTTLAAKLKRIEVLAMDVDGTLTDGSIQLAESGEEIKGFHSRDGIGLKLWKLAGRESAFITARHSKAVTRRAGEVGVRDVILGSADKANTLRSLCARRGVTLEQVAFMGDDLQDLSAMLIAGLSIAVADAPPEVRDRVDLVTKARGGQAAVREAIETLLKAQGKFTAAVNHFLPK